MIFLSIEMIKCCYFSFLKIVDCHEILKRYLEQNSLIRNKVRKYSLPFFILICYLNLSTLSKSVNQRTALIERLWYNANEDEYDNNCNDFYGCVCYNRTVMKGMMSMKTINMGVENFKTAIDNNYYYVDKTELITDVLTNQVMLYTRPRRFGKTLNMSMLYYFFSNKEKENAYLFDGLKITENKEMMKHQNQYPVIFITLKDLSRESMTLQMEKFISTIWRVAENYSELLNSPYLSETEKEIFNRYKTMTATESELRDSLYNLTLFLNKHYGKKTILLIDEYDVPLQSAYAHEYYDDMTMFIRNVFSSALKTNEALERGVLTGCLRIAKESIFTGLNNFTVRSITDKEGNDCFGFTQDEIDDVLDYYQLKDKHLEMKEWYDGYLFGGKEIYNPWSSMNYVSKLVKDKGFVAESFWANTSSNDIVKQYIVNSTPTMKEEFERLIKGKSIVKKISPELTYREMTFNNKDDINDDVYSFLLFTGYLKIKGQVYEENRIQLTNTYELVIPNKEVKVIYETIFMKWFNEYQRVKRNDFIDNLLSGKEKVAQKIMNDVLRNSISFYDNYESFYHGFMLGFLKADGYEVQSNREAGEGRFDIIVMPDEIDETAIIIECKHSRSKATLKKDSEAAIKQIIEKNYQQGIHDEGYGHVMSYGISFFKKQCYITKV